jgi:hypothetical protein
MGIIDKLEEKWDNAEETATGTVGGAIGRDYGALMLHVLTEIAEDLAE